MRKGRRVWDQVEQKFVTTWMGRKEARVARNTMNLLHGSDPAGPFSRFQLSSAKRKRKK